MLYPEGRHYGRASPWFAGRYLEPWDLQRTYTMTVEIIYLTTRIHHWLNVRVARHLAAQAERLAR
jgi:hypothetical protein